MLLRAEMDRSSEDSSLRIKSDSAWSEFQENKSILGKTKNKNHPSPGRYGCGPMVRKLLLQSFTVCV